MMKLHDLVLSRTDAEALAAMLAAHRRGHSPDADPAEALVELLAQARRVPAEALSEDRVTMGSTVTYIEEPSGARRTVTLAYPADADVALRKISVLSPIGLALIGRRRGEVVEALLPGRRVVELRLLDPHGEREALRPAA